jgi:hypothetical protein
MGPLDILVKPAHLFPQKYIEMHKIKYTDLKSTFMYYNL